jgi:hypothetical protein
MAKQHVNNVTSENMTKLVKGSLMELIYADNISFKSYHVQKQGGRNLVRLLWKLFMSKPI